MIPSGPHAPDLFARIASEQDAALAARHAQDDVGRALVERITSRSARRPLRRALIGGGAALALALLLVIAPRLRGLRFEVGSTPMPGAAGAPLAAEARSDLPLRFTDGSTVTFRAGSTGRVERLHDGGAEILVQGGRLEAEVIHADRTRWVVRAGPFSVRVTGTRFSVQWLPDADNAASAGQLVVEVREGAVVVEGGVLGPGVSLTAGQRLNVAAPADGHPPSVQTEALSEASTAAPPAPEPTINADDWRTLAARGAHLEALRAAQRLGLEGLRRELDARGLLALGDVARYARAPREARRTFEALVRRFPDDQLAADAVFSLGRLAVEAARPREAAQWFARYVQKWPDGALAEQAGGRLLEAALAGGEPALVARAAQEYLRRNPQGPQAELARSALQGPAPSAP